MTMAITKVGLRREIFIDLVQEQDAGVPIEASHALIEERFGIGHGTLKAIVTEGLRRVWLDLLPDPDKAAG
jgi:hypothetical protein